MVAKGIRIICMMSMRCLKTLAAVESLSACATHLLHIVISRSPVKTDKLGENSIGPASLLACRFILLFLLPVTHVTKRQRPKRDPSSLQAPTIILFTENEQSKSCRQRNGVNDITTSFVCFRQMRPPFCLPFHNTWRWMKDFGGFICAFPPGSDPESLIPRLAFFALFACSLFSCFCFFDSPVWRFGVPRFGLVFKSKQETQKVKGDDGRYRINTTGVATRCDASELRDADAFAQKLYPPLLHTASMCSISV